MIDIVAVPVPTGDLEMVVLVVGYGGVPGWSTVLVERVGAVVQGIVVFLVVVA